MKTRRCPLCRRKLIEREATEYTTISRFYECQHCDLRWIKVGNLKPRKHMLLAKKVGDDYECPTCRRKFIVKFTAENWTEI